ncbi:MAG: hypothetical protein FH753_07405 [Firmicutes bacterium]|nr:hypothetical protein [Bacillota bacterium]
MDITHNIINENFYIPPSLEKIFNNKKVCFFDIETTGFSRKNSKIILIGLLYFTDEKIHIKQYFADKLTEEKDILKLFIKDIKKFDIYISYNGETFDIPFINKRLSHHGFNYTIYKNKSMDLLKTVRNNKHILNFNNYKLKTVEKNLDIYREDKITGKESIKLYFEYLKKKNYNYKKIILKHNYEDIYYLPKILKIYDKIQDYYTHKLDLYLYDNKHTVNITLDSICMNKNLLNITGKTTTTDLPKQIYYDQNFSLQWLTYNGELNIEIEITKGELSNGNNCYYINKNEFQFTNDLNDLSAYNLPENIILIQENNQILINNIKNILTEIFKKVI